MLAAEIEDDLVWMGGCVCLPLAVPEGGGLVVDFIDGGAVVARKMRNARVSRIPEAGPIAAGARHRATSMTLWLTKFLDEGRISLSCFSSLS